MRAQGLRRGRGAESGCSGSGRLVDESETAETDSAAKNGDGSAGSCSRGRAAVETVR